MVASECVLALQYQRHRKGNIARVVCVAPPSLGKRAHGPTPPAWGEAMSPRGISNFADSATGKPRGFNAKLAQVLEDLQALIDRMGRGIQSLRAKPSETAGQDDPLFCNAQKDATP